MTKTFTIRHEVYIRVEASSAAEARADARQIASALRAVMPTGATLSTSNVLQR